MPGLNILLWWYNSYDDVISEILLSCLKAWQSFKVAVDVESEMSNLVLILCLVCKFHLVRWQLWWCHLRNSLVMLKKWHSNNYNFVSHKSCRTEYCNSPIFHVNYNVKTDRAREWCQFKLPKKWSWWSPFLVKLRPAPFQHLVFSRPVKYLVIFFQRTYIEWTEGKVWIVDAGI